MMCFVANVFNLLLNVVGFLYGFRMTRHRCLGYKVSIGLWTPFPPRFRTCVYIIVVFTSLCPNSSCTVRMS
ncbi:MAG: hypothetical protein QXS96_08170 [Candidatus Caldarchaeum sp.]